MNTRNRSKVVFAVSAISTLVICSMPIFTPAATPKSIGVTNALRLPLPNRLDALEKQGNMGRLELQNIAFNKNESLENRWRALTALGRVYPRQSRTVMEKALQSPDWFMRNAALVVVPYGERKWAVKWARVLMHDPALVVRTAAVVTLRKLNAHDTQDLLWQKLYSSENYRSGQSLWIRRHILEALAQFANRGQEQKFISVLADRDESLHPIAMRTLEKLTHQKFSTTDQWQSWWQVRNSKKI